MTCQPGNPSLSPAHVLLRLYLDMKPEARQIQSLFSRISKPYDMLNHVFSLGIDIWWRKVLVRNVAARHPSRVLDLATGSGDVALMLRKSGLQVVGADFCLPMLQEAQRKGFSPVVAADALQLPFTDTSFEAVTVAYGLRNFVDRPAAIAEVMRVLKPGGCFFILEFSRPWTVLRPFYNFYLETLMPWVTQKAAGEKDAYSYLASSIQAFPHQEELVRLLESCGFKNVSYRNLTFGISALHIAEKPAV